MSALTIRKDNFQKEVLQSDRPVLIDLWATWCGPCRMLSPVVEKIAEEHPEVKVGKINVDEEPELAQSFHATAIPMLVLLRDGKVTASSIGLQPKGKIEEMLK
ncbi:MAG: thioredoxin [Oscillospiraceae bacterium]|nr:thioredoxin [Oscillospiraceae bacterium]